MKKILVLAASTALIFAACGKKDKETVAAAADEAKVEVSEKAAETMNAAEAKAEEAYGSDSKDMEKDMDHDSYGSGDGAAAGVLSSADRSYMVESCVAEGDTKSDCTCVVDAMGSTLSAETAGMFVKMSKLDEAGDAEAAMQLMGSMTPAQQNEVMGFLPKIGECNPEMLQKMMSGG